MDILITGICILLLGNATLAITTSKTAKVKAKAATNSQSSTTLFVAKQRNAARHWARYSRTGIAIYDSQINPLIK